MKGYFGEIRGKSDEGSAGVNGSASILQFEGILAESEAFETDLPVTTSTNG